MSFIPDAEEQAAFIPDAPESVQASDSFIPDPIPLPEVPESGAASSFVRPIAGSILPSAVGAAGAYAGGAYGVAIGSPLGPVGIAAGGIIGALAGGLSARAIAAKAQHEAATLIGGEEWIREQQAQDIANQTAHPYWSGGGALAADIPILFTGGGTAGIAAKMLGASVKGTATVGEMAVAGAKVLAQKPWGAKTLVSRVVESGGMGAVLMGSNAVGAKASDTPFSDQISIPGEIVKGFVTLGPMGLLPHSNFWLAKYGGRAVADSYALSFNSAAYETVVHGKPFNVDAIVGEGTANIPSFLALSAFMALTKGKGMASLVERLKPDSPIVKAEKGLSDLEAKYATTEGSVGEKAIMSLEDIKLKASYEKIINDAKKPIEPTGEFKKRSADVEAERVRLEAEDKALDKIVEDQNKIKDAIAVNEEAGFKPTDPIEVAEVPDNVNVAAIVEKAKTDIAGLNDIQAVRDLDVTSYLESGAATGDKTYDLDTAINDLKAQRLSQLGVTSKNFSEVIVDPVTGYELTPASVAAELKKAENQVARAKVDENSIRVQEEESASKAAHESGSNIIDEPTAGKIREMEELQKNPTPENQARWDVLHQEVDAAMSVKLADKGIIIPVEAQPIVDRLQELRADTTVDRSSDIAKAHKELADILLPAAKRLPVPEISKDLPEAAKAVAERRTIVETAVSAAKEIAKNLGVEVDFVYSKTTRYLSKETKEGQATIRAQMKATRPDVTEQEIQDELKSNRQWRVSGSTRKGRVYDRHTGRRRTTVVLYIGHDGSYKGLSPRVVAHELAHAIDLQGGFPSWKGGQEELAVTLSEIIHTDLARSLPKVLDFGAVVGEPVVERKVAPAKAPTSSKVYPDTPVGAAERNNDAAVKRVSDAKKESERLRSRLNRHIESGVAKGTQKLESYKKKRDVLTQEIKAAGKELKVATSRLIGTEKELVAANLKLERDIKREKTAQERFIKGYDKVERKYAATELTPIQQRVIELGGIKQYSQKVMRGIKSDRLKSKLSGSEEYESIAPRFRSRTSEKGQNKEIIRARKKFEAEEKAREIEAARNKVEFVPRKWDKTNPDWRGQARRKANQTGLYADEMLVSLRDLTPEGYLESDLQRELSRDNVRSKQVSQEAYDAFNRPSGQEVWEAYGRGEWLQRMNQERGEIKQAAVDKAIVDKAVEEMPAEEVVPEEGAEPEFFSAEPTDKNLKLDVQTPEDVQAERDLAEAEAKVAMLKEKAAARAEAKAKRRSQGIAEDQQGILFVPEGETPSLFAPIAKIIEPEGPTGPVTKLPSAETGELFSASPVEEQGPGSSLAREAISDRLEVLGLPLRVAKQLGFDEILAKGHSTILAGFRRGINVGLDLVTSLQTGKPRSLTPDDIGVMGSYKVMLENQFDTAAADIRRAQETGNAELLADATQRMTSVNAQNDNLHRVLAPGERSAVTSTARALGALRMILARDYSLMNIRRRLQAAKGIEPLDVAEEKIVQDTFDKWQSAEDRLSESQVDLDAEAKVQQQEDVNSWTKQKIEAKKERVQSSWTPIRKLTEDPRIRDAAISKGKSALEKIKAMQAERAAKLANPPAEGSKPAESFFAEPIDAPKDEVPTDIKEQMPFLVELGQAKMAEGLKDFKAWADSMVADIGENYRPYLDAIRKTALNEVATIERGMSVKDEAAQLELAMDSRPSMKMPESEKEFVQQVKLLMKAEAAKGTDLLDDALDNVKATMKRWYPEVELDDIRDANSDYGKSTQPSSNVVSARLTKWRRESQLISQIIALRTQEAPLKTGKGRLPQFPSERELIRIRNDAQKTEEMRRKKTGQPPLGDPAKRMKTALETVKARIRNSILDVEAEIVAGKRIQRESGVEYDTEALSLQKTLQDLRTVLDEKIGPRMPTEEQQLATLTKAAERANKALEDRIANNELFIEKVKKVQPTSPELEATRERTKQLREKLKALQDVERPPLTEFEKQIRNRDNFLRRVISKTQAKLDAGDFEPPPPKPERPVGPETFKLMEEKRKIESDFEHALAEYKFKNRTMGQKMIDYAVEPFTLARALLSSYDLSGFGRQGAMFVLSHPVLASKTFGPMLKAFRSDFNAFKLDEAMRADPLKMQDYKKMGLFLSDMENSADVLRTEEAFSSKWIKPFYRIPGVKSSQRSYITVLNLMRASWADTLVNSMGGREKMTDEQFRSIGKFINIATGRGEMGQFAMASHALSTVLWSPRLLWSRFQMLLGQPIIGGAKGTRKMIAGEYARIIAGAGIVYALGAMLGGKEEKDPRSSDFGKIRFGDVRIDPLAGLSQVTVMLSRMVSGSSKTSSGDIVQLSGENAKFGNDSMDVLSRFARSKLSPLAGTVVNLASGKTVVGEPVTKWSMARDLAIPLSWRDTYDTLSQQGMAAGMIMQTLNVLGVGVQSYAAKNPEPKKAKKMEKTNGSSV